MVNGDCYLGDILKNYPETLEVFIANGFEDFADNDIFMEIGPFVRLKTLLKARNKNINYFLGLLDEKINSKKNNGTKSEKLEINDRMNLLALLPCPLKLPIQEAFNKHLEGIKDMGFNSFEYLIEGNANNQLSYYNYVENFDSIDEVPDIVISPGINSFYYKNFVNKFIDKGYFTDVTTYMPCEELAKVGIRDPGNNYTIFSMNLLVMVADKLALGDIKVPKSWGDLLNSEFYKKVAIRGQNDFFCETTLLTIFKSYGIEGIKKLGRTVKYGWHPAQMAKAAGSGNSNSPAVSVMPYFFTKTIKHKENIEVIWPEDGAIVSPVTMLVKAEKAEKLKGITDFFTGYDVSNICAKASFPSLNPGVDYQIPRKVRFNWIGWDFIKGNDIGELVKMLNNEFIKDFYKG